MTEIIDHGPNPLIANVEQVTLENTNYRTTLWTGTHLQVTLMAIQPGHDIGLEVHNTTDQFLKIDEGTATVYFGDTKENLTSQEAKSGDAVIVPARTWHNLVNSGDVPLKISSIYAPPEHPHSTVHVTKEQANAEEAE